MNLGKMIGASPVRGTTTLQNDEPNGQILPLIIISQRGILEEAVGVEENAGVDRSFVLFTFNYWKGFYWEGGEGICMNNCLFKVKVNRILVLPSSHLFQVKIISF